MKNLKFTLCINQNNISNIQLFLNANFFFLYGNIFNKQDQILKGIRYL